MAQVATKVLIQCRLDLKVALNSVRRLQALILVLVDIWLDEGLLPLSKVHLIRTESPIAIGDFGFA